jgi:hypothetical protein
VIEYNPPPLDQGCISVPYSEFLKETVYQSSFYGIVARGFAAKLEEGKKVFDGHDDVKYIFESMFLEKIVNNFQTYVADLMFNIYNLHPKIFFKRKFDISTVFEFHDIEEFKKHLIEGEVRDLAYKGISELHSFMLEKSGFCLFANQFQIVKVQQIYYLRNLIAHNRSKANKFYVQQTRRKGLKISDRVPIYDAFRIQLYLDWVADGIDRRAVQKFDFPENQLIRREIE